MACVDPFFGHFNFHVRRSGKPLLDTRKRPITCMDMHLKYFKYSILRYSEDAACERQYSVECLWGMRSVLQEMSTRDVA